MIVIKTKKYIKNLIVTMIAFTIFICICIWYFNNVTNRLYDEAIDRIVSETNHGAAIMKSEIQKSLEEVVSVSYSLSDDKGNKDDILRYLKFFADKKNYLRFSYYDLNGNMSTTDDINYNIVGTDTFIENTKGNSSISKPTYDVAGKAQIIAFSSPVPIDGEMKYGIIGSRYADTVFDKLSNGFFDGKGYSFIVDGKGDILIHPVHDDYINNSSNCFEKFGSETTDYSLITKMKDDLSNRGSGIFSFPLDGKQKIVSYAPIEGINDWYILCVIPNYTISKNQMNIRITTLILLVWVAVLVASVFIYILMIEKRNRQQVEKLAFTDDLTGARNINKFKIDAGDVLSKYKDDKFAVIKFDINNFKLINDIYGFEVGDMILKNISYVISQKIGKDDVFGRVSNDDFIIFLKYDNDIDLTAKGQEYIEGFQRINEDLIQNYKIDFSIGICKNDNKDDIVKMIERATMAQKFSKSSSYSNFTYYDDSMRNTALKTKEIENSMNDALLKGEFVIYIQPKNKLINGDIEGAEALIRWKHPQKGIIPPMEFIPLFEQNGFIVNIDLFVLEEICKLQRRNLDNGKKIIPISLNQSKVLINQPNYIEKVVNIAQKYDVPFHLIELELTETTIHENTELLKQIVNGLSQLGFIISIDDFGSGYSSLNLLKEIPSNILKIDREFLNKSEDNKRGYIVLENIIKLAKDLGMLVVTEGIETEEQVNFLKELGCDMGQGYYYSRPMAMDDFEKLL